MPRLVSWDEMFRPRSLSDIIDVNGNIALIQRQLVGKNHKHYLLCGPPGTGKTTAARAIAIEWLRINTEHLKSTEADFIIQKITELNASDERGIEMVRSTIKSIVSQRGIRVIILDEADAMTKDAQQALRRMMEKAKQNPKSPKLFILTGNYPNKIIEPIHSRCEVLNFSLIPFPILRKKLVDIVKSQKISDIEFPGSALTAEDKKEAFEEFWKSIYRVSKGDMRKAIGLTQNYVKGKKLDMTEPPLSFVAEEFKVILDSVIRPVNEENSYAQVYSVVENLIRNPKRHMRWSPEDFISSALEWLQGFSQEVPPYLGYQLASTVSKFGHRLKMGNDVLAQIPSMIVEMRLARMVSIIQENEQSRLDSIQAELDSLKKDVYAKVEDEIPVAASSE